MVLPSTPICSICLGALVRTPFRTHRCHLLFHKTCLYRSLSGSQTLAPSCPYCHRLFCLVHLRRLVWQVSQLEGGKWSQLVESPQRPCSPPAHSCNWLYLQVMDPTPAPSDPSRAQVSEPICLNLTTPLSPNSFIHLVSLPGHGPHTTGSPRSPPISPSGKCHSMVLVLVSCSWTAGP